jgi:hypothetical protein
LQNKKHCQSHSTGYDRDNSSPDNVGPVVDALIVSDGSITQVVHPADGGATEDTSSDDSPPSYSIRDAYCVEGGEEKDDRHAEREHCNANGVVDLHLGLSLGEGEGLVSYEMLHQK